MTLRVNTDRVLPMRDGPVRAEGYEVRTMNAMNWLYAQMAWELRLDDLRKKRRTPVETTKPGALPEAA
jgi:hypothetical protein